VHPVYFVIFGLLALYESLTYLLTYLLTNSAVVVWSVLVLTLSWVYKWASSSC